MFSGNDRISARQINRLLIYDLFGVSSLLLPGLLAKSCGTEGIWAVAVGGILLSVYLLFLKKMFVHMDGSYAGFIKKTAGNVMGELILIFYFFCCVSFGGYGIFLLGRVVKNNLIRETSYYVVAATVLLLAVYGIKSGIEGRARVYEILFWFLMIPLFFMLAFAAKDVDTGQWIPVVTGNTAGLASGIWYVICFFSFFFLLPFLREFAVEKGAVLKGAKRALVFLIALTVVIYEILLGIFGTEALAGSRDPVIILMSLIKLPGGFLKRLDAVMTGIWFFTLFALVSSALFYGKVVFKAVFDTKREMPPVLASTAGVCVAAALLYETDWLEGAAYEIAGKIAVPLLIVIPMILYLMCLGKKKGKIGMSVCAVIAAGFLLGGCGTELEDKSFPLSMAFDKAEDAYHVAFEFPDLSEAANTNTDAKSAVYAAQSGDTWKSAWDTYEKNSYQETDYNHMKVIVFGRAFFEQKAELKDFLLFIQEEQKLPGNTLVFLTDGNADEILMTAKDLETSVGNYLEELTGQKDDTSDEKVVNLQMLINACHDEDKEMKIPLIGCGEGGIVQDGYVPLTGLSIVKETPAARAF